MLAKQVAKSSKVVSRILRRPAILSSLEDVFVVLSGVMILILMILTDINVLGRYLFNKPLIGTIEVATLLLVILMMLPLAYVQRIRGHLGVELLFERVSPRKRAFMMLSTLIVLLPVLVILTRQSAVYTARSWDGYFAALFPIPYWPALIAVPIGFGLLCVRILYQIFKIIADLRGSRTEGESK